MCEASSVKPVRLQLSRRKGFDLQLHSFRTNGLAAVSVARPSIFGNPWRVGAQPYFSLDMVLSLHRCWITGAASDEDVGPQAAELRKGVLGRLHALRGKNLACYCQLPDPYERDRCHAAILLQLANA
ncbi:MAG: DUF4326 domain-containing protein [Rhizobiales bacterium]|nr:DUF4326 domain-containing protein [Hyphomicrobiales bacterium]